MSVSNLLTAADFTAAGWRTPSVTTEKGAGKYAVSMCQKNDPTQVPGFINAAKGSMHIPEHYGRQLVMSFETEAAATQAYELFDEWQRACELGARKAVKVSGVVAKAWVSLPKDPSSGLVISEAVTAIRAGSRVSVVVLQTGNLPKGLNLGALASRTLARLT